MCRNKFIPTIVPKAERGLEEFECSKVLSLLGNESESFLVMSEYWSGWPFPSPGDLPDPGSERRSPALQADFLPSEPPGNLTLKVQFIPGGNNNLTM